MTSFDFGNYESCIIHEKGNLSSKFNNRNLPKVSMGPDNTLLYPLNDTTIVSQLDKSPKIYGILKFIFYKVQSFVSPRMDLNFRHKVVTL